MKHLKKFNENFEDSIKKVNYYQRQNLLNNVFGDRNKTKQDKNLDNFYNDYKSALSPSEEDFDQGYEPSHIELYNSLGELCLKYDLTKEDVKSVLDNYDCGFDVDKLLQSTYDYWVD